MDWRLRHVQVYRRAEFTLEVNQILRLDLSAGGRIERKRAVTDTAPALNTETASRGEVTSHSDIKEMPLDGRNISDLALLSGGVIPKGDGSDGSYAVNGAHGDNTGLLLDGVNNRRRRNTGAVINPPIEGLQEFKMLTSGFSAEYRRYAGGMGRCLYASTSAANRPTLHEQNEPSGNFPSFVAGSNPVSRNLRDFLLKLKVHYRVQVIRCSRAGVDNLHRD